MEEPEEDVVCSIRCKRLVEWKLVTTPSVSGMRAESHGRWTLKPVTNHNCHHVQGLSVQERPLQHTLLTPAPASCVA